MNKMAGRRWIAAGAAGLAVVLSGCGTTSDDAYFRSTPSSANVYVSPGPRTIRKVAVLPFKAPTELIGASISDLFVTEMLRAGRYELVERSRLSSVLGESELALSGLSAGGAAKVGSMVGADAVITGTVDEYGTVAQRGKTLPVVGITARMIDCSSGQIVWSVDLAKRGGSGMTMPQEARMVVHEMMAALYRKWH